MCVLLEYLFHTVHLKPTIIQSVQDVRWSINYICLNHALWSVVIWPWELYSLVKFLLLTHIRSCIVNYTEPV